MVSQNSVENACLCDREQGMSSCPTYIIVTLYETEVIYHESDICFWAFRRLDFSMVNVYEDNFASFRENPFNKSFCVFKGVG